MSSIDNIIALCESNFTFPINDSSRKMYLEFLERQLEKHPEYDLSESVESGGFGKSYTDFKYVNALVDKLLLFSYIVGETPIIKDLVGTTINIGRDENGDLKPIEDRGEDLYYLNVGINKRKTPKTDFQLSRLRARLSNKIISNGWITELGQDVAVIDYFEASFTYSNGIFTLTPQQIKN